MDARHKAGHDEWSFSHEQDASQPRATLRGCLVAADDVPAGDARYAVALPGTLADLIDRNDPHDPIARQFVPSEAELDASPEELADPIGDDAHSPVPGIVHRYPDRVLLKLTQICAVYCRFCFRREMVGPGKPGALNRAALAAALNYIRELQKSGRSSSPAAIRWCCRRGGCAR